MTSANGLFPNFFDVMGKALPALVGEIPNPTRDVELSFIEIRKRLREISSVYQTKLRSNDVRSNWREPANRCAYVFLYFVKHSHLVYEALMANRAYFDLCWVRGQRREIKVCSIGGGPGSDIAGVIAFLNTMQYGQSLRCSVLDLYPEWQSTWEDIKTQIPPTKLKSLLVQYHKYDMIEEPPFARDVGNALRSADLVTFVKSFSTVSTVSMIFTKVLPEIMQALKPGAFVLFIDNSANQMANASFRRIAEKAGLQMLHVYDHHVRLSVPATSLVLGFSASSCFDYNPLRTCSVTIYLLQKPRVGVAPMLYDPVLQHYLSIRLSQRFWV